MRIIKAKQWNKKLLALIVHPSTLSLFVTLIILLIVPFNIPKYILKVQESTRTLIPNVYVWDDLEQDGISDRIVFGTYETGTLFVAVNMYPSGTVKEWNISGKFLNDFFNNFFLIAAPTKTDKKEVFFFTRSNDSLFLNHIPDVLGKEQAVQRLFLSTTQFVNNVIDCNVITPRLDDLDGDGAKELIFGLNAGFSLSPRAIFIYDFSKDSLMRSMETGNSVMDFLVADVNGDERKEIITMGYSPWNFQDTIVTYNDSSNWAMVFDHNLKLLFPPVEFPGRAGSTWAYNGLNNNSHFLKFYYLWQPPEKNPHGFQLFQFTFQGCKKMVKEFSEVDKRLLRGKKLLMQTGSEFKWIFPLQTGEIYLFDTSFRKSDIIGLDQQVDYLDTMDVDLDGQPEFLIYNYVLNTMTILRNNFSHPAIIKLELSDMRKTKLSVKKGKDKLPLINLSTGTLCYSMSYKKNPWWYAYPVFWAAIWLAVLLFALLVRRIQRIQLEKRFATEKKITELQMKIVRNQMDPHFTMNAINAVMDAINREEKEEARDNLLHFSKMYRSLVLSADKIKRPLKDELEFTENYLALEQFRFGNRFTYKIEIDPSVDLAWEVPKMVIQSPVENAVKHGLLKREPGGEVVIHVFLEGHNLILEITDNGIGREQSSKTEKSSTGKGIQIMEQFFELYHKITGVRVNSEITDLNDSDTGKTGTKVRTVVQR